MWHMTQSETEQRGRWRDPEIVTVGDKTFRVIVHLRSDVQLTDAQYAYGLRAVLSGETVAEVKRLMAWQDQKARDYEQLNRDGML